MKFVSVLMIQILAIVTQCAVRSIAKAPTTITQGLRVELVHDSNHKGICTEEFYAAVETNLFAFTKSTASTVLVQHGMDPDDFVFDSFHLGSVNVRNRRLLRGKDEQGNPSGQQPPLEEGGVPLEIQKMRELPTNQYSTSCRACSKPSCSSYCSGCYLCQSNRRDLLSKGSGGGGVTPKIMKQVESELQSHIQAEFSTWLKGSGKALAKGCLGDRNKVKINAVLM